MRFLNKNIRRHFQLLPNSNVIDADAQSIYNRIIADNGVSNLSRLNYLVKGLKTIYGSLSNTPVCYDAHWIGYQPANGVGATSGQACAKLYSLTVAGDAVQATASQQPLLLAHNGAVTDNYWYGSGVTGNYVSTPNAVANQIVGTIEYKAWIRNNSWGTSSYCLYKGSGSNKGSGMYFYTSAGVKYIVFRYSIDGSSDSFLFSDPHTLSDNVDYVIKYSGIAGGIGSFWYSTDNGVTFTQIGVNKSHPATWFNSTGVLNIGAYGDGSSDFQGKIYRATIANSIGGTPVVDFNPASYNAATSQTQWTSSTGATWTINTGTATTGYKGVLVDRTIVQSDGVDDKLENAAIAINQPNTLYFTIRELSTDTKGMIDGVTGVREIVRFPSNSIGMTAGTLLSGVSPLGLRKLITAQFNTTSSVLDVNNSNIANGNAGTQNAVGIRVANGVDGFCNLNVNTVIFSNLADNTTNKTAMYNFIKSLNNNAF